MKTMKILSLGFIIAFLYSGCTNGLMEFGRAESNDAAGSVTITLEAGGEERTLRPDRIVDISVFDRIIIDFTRTDAGDITDELILEKADFESGETSFTRELGVGQWDISVTGYILFGDEYYEAATGSASASVSGISGEFILITLYTGILDGLPGVFSYNVEFSTEVDIKEAVLKITPFDVFIGIEDDTDGVITIDDLFDNPQDTFDLQPGYYILEAEAESDTGKKAVWVELFHIYSGQETLAEYEFKTSYFSDARRKLEGSASITGTADYRIGEILGLDVSDITGVGVAGTYDYRWQLDGVDISGENGTTYTITSGDVGKVIRVVITHAEADGEIIATGGRVPYEIEIELVDEEAEDTVTAVPAFGHEGDQITLNYTITVLHDKYQLVFSGTEDEITKVESSVDQITGTRPYVINVSDAEDGVITITATFIHADLIEDTITFDITELTVTYGDDGNTFTKALTATGAGSGLVTYESSDETVATVNNIGEVTVLKVGTATITALKAADDDHTGADASYELTVEQRPVTITGISADDKVYNGDRVAVVLGIPVLTNVFAGDDDDVTIVTGTALFDTRDAGDNKTVSFTGWALTGDKAENYILTAQPADDTANITQLQLTVSAPTGTATRAYNGTTTAPTGGIVIGSFTNIIGTDSVFLAYTATFDTPVAGEGKQITIVYSISGAQEDNYIKPVNDTSLTGTINRAPGAAVDGIPVATHVTHNSITVEVLTVVAPASPMFDEQVVEYAISQEAAPTDANLAWQLGITFDNLEPKTGYYVFARSMISDNYNAGTQATRVRSELIPTIEEMSSLELTFTITNAANEVVQLTGDSHFEVSAIESFTITVDGVYSYYTWIIDDTIVRQGAIVQNGNFTINGIEFTEGDHNLLVIVQRNGIPYSREITFTVTD